MLLNLHVKNFALIDECEVEFDKGLNILTGETGAGKSIIIDSINYALGAKIPKDIIRDEEAPALIELVFDIPNENVRAQLEAMEISCDDDLCLITRKITGSRSVSKINGETVSAAQVKKIAELLIDIHGQHEHQSLLNKKKHLEILDEYGKEEIEPLKEEVSLLYKEFCNTKAELQRISINDDDRRREVSFLEYEINEIESARLTEGEDEQLEKDYKRLQNGRKIIDTLSEVYSITGYSGNASAGNGIGEALRRLGNIVEYDEELEKLNYALSDAESILNDFNRELSNYMSVNEFSPQEFAEVEERLNLVNDLKNKYGRTITLILKALEDKKDKLFELNNADERIRILQERLLQCEEKLQFKAGRLSSARNRYANDLAVKIRDSLVDLNFLQVEFVIEVRAVDISANGGDEVEFLISTNPGENVRALGLVASGGELSRIMLAIKTILAESDEIPSLIFDEIDAGISGRTAQKVSEKLHLVGESHQVICITHLPQIASMADTHFLIEKGIVGMQTISNISKLSFDDSVMELARMLGGAQITETVLANAREMKEMARKQ